MNVTDAARPLTERGEEQARLVGVALARLGANFELVLYSPKVRSVRTAAIALAEVGHSDVARSSEALASGLDARFVFDELAGLGARRARCCWSAMSRILTTLIAELTGRPRGPQEGRDGGCAPRRRRDR